MEPIEVSTYETWRAMEQLVTEGLVKYVYILLYITSDHSSFYWSIFAFKLIKSIYIIRNIGLSNYNLQGIREVVSYAKIKPAVLQIVSILT